MLQARPKGDAFMLSPTVPWAYQDTAAFKFNLNSTLAQIL